MAPECRDKGAQEQAGGIGKAVSGPSPFPDPAAGKMLKPRGSSLAKQNKPQDPWTLELTSLY